MELSLDLSLVYVPKTISEYLKEVSKVKDASLRLSKLDDFVKRLEDEMRKIDAFKRELPLCMLLLNDAIVKLKEEAMQCKRSKDPVPVKGNSGKDDISDKKNWMSSVQLWNSNDIDFNSKKQDSISEIRQKSEEEDDRSTCENPIQLCNSRSKRGAFVPFKAISGFEGTERKEEKEVMSQVTGLSLMTPVPELGTCNLMSKSNNVTNQMKIQSKPHQQQQPYKKQRRCWSPELHRRFVDALQQLGGSQVATPKQIRELMQVDGLTNDEVKSHLQKYRLHIRKLPASSAAQANALWLAKCEDSSKPNISESAKDISSTGDDSMDVVDDNDDNKSESHSWNDTNIRGKSDCKE
ncbi:transcription factor HHO5 [Jatropha curcas]|uniref:transcription factor HHO5 n=1 Tax=Jatropha curcas TaxID=180498 RepID=UPI0005FBFD08|nr:transcription factor HHO5 [Jatropha curcas]